jgi:hypothetical protein
VDLFAGEVPIMGEAARGWLFQGQHGRVLAAVTHATYLLTEAGELLWLATQESPEHRRRIQWPAPLPRLAVDSTFTIRNRSINLEAGANLDFRASHLWEASVLPTREVVGIGLLPKNIFEVVESLLAMEMPVGFGTFIRPVLQILRKRGAAINFQPEDILTKTSWPIVERIAWACLSHDLPGVLKQAEVLIGFGEGLTPSGDDFLGGLFFARVLVSCAYPQLNYLKLTNLPEWIDTFQSHTNLISFALLKDNVTGHTLEPLNRFGLALLTNRPVECAASAAGLIKVGHSTGWSLLTGFLVGMLLAFPEESCMPRY